MAAPNDGMERMGVVRDEQTGELILPATQRPDGTWRKARRVKDGYVPQEEVPVYESKGMQFVKSIPDYPIGLPQEDIEKLRKLRSDKAQGETAAPAKAMSKSAKKNAKRKEKKKQGACAETEKVTSSLSDMKLAPSEPSDKAPSQEEIAKKIKNLKKKVRQIEDLEAKISSGELKNPEKDQLEKIKKKQSILEEIEDLELDLED